MKSPRLQLHFSTCIVLMFVAGGLLWANVRPQSIEVELSNDVPLNPDPLVIGIVRGWPTTFHVEYLFADSNYGYLPWNRTHLLINIITNLAILAVTAFACEWRIRRREACKP